MPRSVGLEAFHKRAEAYSKGLRATDPRFKHAVHLIHEEGTTFFYKYAFLIEDKDYIAVLAEHHDVNSFCKDDLYSWSEWSRVDETRSLGS